MAKSCGSTLTGGCIYHPDRVHRCEWQAFDYGHGRHYCRCRTSWAVMLDELANDGTPAAPDAPEEPTELPSALLTATLADLGITQAELARRTGFSTKHINFVIKGKAGVGVDLANALAAATGVPADRWLHAEANRLSGSAARDNIALPGPCHGCGSTRVVTRNRLAYCTEPTCDRRLPGPPCETCTRPRSLHVCLSCSPDGLTTGSGCGNCRHTGWNQTPCLPPVAAPAT